MSVFFGKCQKMSSSKTTKLYLLDTHQMNFLALCTEVVKSTDTEILFDTTCLKRYDLR